MRGLTLHPRRRSTTTDPGRSETVDLYGAYPRLSHEQMTLLAAAGERRTVRRDQVLFREGDATCDFFAIGDGTVTVVEGYGTGEQHLLGVHGPGRFLGELGLLTGEAVFVTAVVGDPGEVIAVPVPRLKDLVTHDPALGDIILRAYILRRAALIGLGAGLRIVGSRFSADTRRLREFAARNRLPHAWTDVEEDPEAEMLLRRLAIPPEDTPVVIWSGDRVLRNPSNAELAGVIGLRAPSLADIICDLLVVGAGPGGLAAAVYGASEGLSTFMVDSTAAGGQAATSSRIENYLGFPAGISGAELADRAVVQAERFGARLSIPAEARGLERQEGHHVVRLDDGSSLTARTVLVASGACYRRLAVDRIEEFEGTSIYYAATDAEARMCRNDPIAIVGGGNSAGQAALFLSRHAGAVTLIVRHADLRRDMSRYLVDRIKRSTVDIMSPSEVRTLLGDGTLEALVVEDIASGHRRTVPARALFVFIGVEPAADWLGGQLARDGHGFILTGTSVTEHDGFALWDMGRHPMALETNRPGVFAAGDVRSRSVKRVAAAVGEGSMAVRLIHEHLADRWGDQRG